MCAFFTLPSSRPARNDASSTSMHEICSCMPSGSVVLRMMACALFLLGVADPTALYAQGTCGSGFVLTSQAEVDTFDCTVVTGPVFISGPDITNLDALSSLTSVGGGLDISLNPALTNVDGLSSLITVSGSLSIFRNATLTNVDGLSSLTSVGISGTADGVSIVENQALTNLDGLSSLTFVAFDLNVSTNPALASCCGLFPLLNGGGVGGPVVISGNGAGCTEAEILSGGPCLVEPAVAINALVDDVAELVATNALKESHGRALTNKLVSALKQLDKGNTASVIGKLQGVIDQLVGLTAAGQVDGAIADALISDAQAITDALQSPSKSTVPTPRASAKASTWSCVKVIYR